MSTVPDCPTAQWIKSSYSGNGGGSCVEWAPSQAASGVLPVRDSKVPNGRSLLFSPSAWRAFTTALRHPEPPRP